VFTNAANQNDQDFGLFTHATNGTEGGIQKFDFGRR
jgi:hypothetical protein